jgi:O-antigen/teichoic acid export membrane protein
VYGQAIQAVLQLVGVPLFATFWGVHAYGLWLMLYSVPAYFALADLGFGTAAGNQMTISVARNDLAEAASIYGAVRVAALTVGLLLLSISAALIFNAPRGWFSSVDAISAHPRTLLLALIFYGVLALQNTVTLGAFRASGKYALGTALQTSILFAEGLGALAVVASGGGADAVAWTYLAIRLLGTGLLIVVARAKVRWLRARRLTPFRRALGQIVGPAAAVMAIPLAQALSLQGTALVIGWAAGPSAVPAFVAVRTLVRLGIQLTAVLHHAVMPEFAIAVAQSDRRRAGRLSFMTLGVSLASMAPICLILAVSGPTLVQLWTSNKVHASNALVLVMCCAALAHGLWLPMSNLLLALNRQSTFSYFYALSAAAALGLAFPLSSQLGAPGAAISLLCLDVLMFIRVAIVASSESIFDHRVVASFLRAMEHALRTRTLPSRVRRGD